VGVFVGISFGCSAELELPVGFGVFVGVEDSVDVDAELYVDVDDTGS
jgi:hypothetical protein